MCIAHLKISGILKWGYFETLRSAMFAGPLDTLVDHDSGPIVVLDCLDGLVYQHPVVARPKKRWLPQAFLSIFGFSSSLSQSAKRLMPTTNRTKAAPEKTIIHHIPT